MMKNVLVSTLLPLLFIAVFNILFFMIGGTNHPSSVWISYGFIHFAYLTVWFLPILLKSEGDSSYYLSAPMYAMCMQYFVVEFIVGLIFILLSPESNAWTISIQSIVLCICLFPILGLAKANLITGNQLAKREIDISAYQTARTEIKKLLSRSSIDPTLQKLIVSCHDKMEASASRATPKSAQIDASITQVISIIRQAMQERDIETCICQARILLELIEERRDLLKYSH